MAHFGESEQTIVENLLYLYTEPFDIVVDLLAESVGTTPDNPSFRTAIARLRKEMPEEWDTLVQKLIVATKAS